MSHSTSKEKVPRQSLEEFIRYTAIDCISTLDDKDKETLRYHPLMTDYFYTFGIYIRNRYIHCMDFSEVDFEVDPDPLSGAIMDYVFSLLLPEEYVYGDSFSSRLFNDYSFVQIRKAYYWLKDEFPVETVQKYRRKAGEAVRRLELRCMIRPEIRRRSQPAQDILLEKKWKMETGYIESLVREIADTLWNDDEVMEITRSCGIPTEPVATQIQRIKDDLSNGRGHFLPLTAALLPFRDQIGEDRYEMYRTELCHILKDYPRLITMLEDKSWRKDPVIVKSVIQVGSDIEDFPEYKNNDEIVRYTLELDGSAIQYVNPRYWEDREWIRFAIEHSERSTILSNCCMEAWRSDKEMAYLAWH